MGLADELKYQIEHKYVERGDRLGWRLLYSPSSVLLGAEVAFIGLNPGGDVDEPDHPSFALPAGSSAYADESWKGQRPGEEALQKQVRLLFAMLGAEPTAVLAGNLVPFRSPDWASLSDPSDALQFGRELWRTILAAAKPQLVIAMGRPAAQNVAAILGVREEPVSVGWGTLVGTRGHAGDIRFVGLPHLSRFRLLGRDQSQAGLKALFFGANA